MPPLGGEPTVKTTCAGLPEPPPPPGGARGQKRRVEEGCLPRHMLLFCCSQVTNLRGQSSGSRCFPGLRPPGPRGRTLPSAARRTDGRRFETWSADRKQTPVTVSPGHSDPPCWMNSVSAGQRLTFQSLWCCRSACEGGSPWLPEIPPLWALVGQACSHRGR